MESAFSGRCWSNEWERLQESSLLERRRKAEMDFLWTNCVRHVLLVASKTTPGRPTLPGKSFHESSCM